LEKALQHSSHDGQILTGVAGWSYTDWAGIVYPARRSRDFRELAYLANYFDTVEINTSFYQPLRPELADLWLAQIASNPRFTFTAKLWQRFTHETAADESEERSVRAGFAPLLRAGRLGAVLLQFPHSFHFSRESASVLRKLLVRFADLPLVVEVRHNSWNRDDFYQLLREHDAGFCNLDQPQVGRTLAPSEHSTSGIGYVRLHGRRHDTWFSDDPSLPGYERYNYLYDEKELAGWVPGIRNVARHSRTTFVVANNHFQGKSVVNALQLIHLLSEAKIRVPDPLRQQYPQLDAIADSPSEEPTLFPNPPR
jgi:uncharacterized protein YecE (DUF72 family)